MNIKCTVSFCMVLMMVLTSFQLQAQETKVWGYVVSEDGEALANTAIFVSEKKGVTSSESGYYELFLPSDSVYSLRASNVAFKPWKKRLKLKSGQEKRIDIRLYYDVNLMTTVELTDNTHKDRLNNNIEIKVKDINKLAGANNSVEALIKQTTSAIGNNELSSQYNVRGGNFDENLVYVNGLQIYRPFLVRTGEQEGLSFLNSDMVESIRFSAGGFEAKYGDKLSSVLDISYREADTLSLKANLSFQGAGLTISNPFKVANRPLSFIGSFRYKSPTFLLNSLETQGDYRPRFSDAQVFMKYDLSLRSDFSFLGNYSQSVYQFIPESRTSTFGTASDVKQLYVYFEGQEVDNYDNSNLAFKWDYKASDQIQLSWQASHFRTLEREFYDIDGYYILGLVDNNPGSENFGSVTSVTGVGEFLNHGRNEFYAQVSNLNHRGVWTSDDQLSKWSWGIDVQNESIEDQLLEWQYIDSLGFSVNDNTNDLELYESVRTSNTIHSNRMFGFAQYEHKFLAKDSALWAYNVGLRAQYWDLNQELFLTPRSHVSYKPHWEKDIVFRYALGMYNQSPFYRDLRAKNGELNRNLKSQKSVQTSFSLDYNLEIWNRPFRMTSEVYYKKLWDVVPYELENLQIRYLPFEQARAYVYGLEWRLNGEIVPGDESFVSFGFMQNKEDILGDGHGYIPKPTEQVFSMSMFYQDHFKNHKDIKFHLSASYATGMPFGAPNTARAAQTLRNSSYRRVDVGFSKALIKKRSQKGFKKHIKNAWASIEILNLLNINNSAGHLWVSDANRTQFAVPNYLTGRMINLKFSVEL
ncbi:MAG: TonB-dependent receptor [Flavobacteriales bacterium]